MRLAFHPFAQQNPFRCCDDHRRADLISEVALLAPTCADAHFLRGYSLQDLHRLAEAKKSYCSGRGSFSRRAPREQDPSVFFTISSNAPVTPRDPDFQ